MDLETDAKRRENTDDTDESENERNYIHKSIKSLTDS